MYADLSCGRCDSTFSIDADDEDPVWLLVMRFANAHADCGYMTPLSDTNDGEATRTKIIKPRLTGESEEA
jgi:hypothetical protein